MTAWRVAGVARGNGRSTKRALSIAMLVLAQVALFAVPAHAKTPKGTTVTATAPFAAAATSVRPFGSCTSLDVCSRRASPATGEVEATAVYVSADGVQKASTLWESIQDFVEVDRAKHVTVVATVQIDRADAATITAAGGIAESRLTASLLAWAPQEWAFRSSDVTLAESTDTGSASFEPGALTVSFSFRVPERPTTGPIGLQVEFQQFVRADSSEGGSSAAAATFEATVESLSVTYR